MGQQGADQVCSSTTAFLLAIALTVTFHGDKNTHTTLKKYRIKKNISKKLLFIMVLTS